MSLLMLSVTLQRGQRLVDTSFRGPVLLTTPCDACMGSSVDVSIVVPVLNGMPYLESTLRSILSQSSKWSFEVIVVDNGSSDRSVDIIRAMSENWPALRVVVEERTNVVEARHRGLTEVEAPFIVFFDHDDVMYPGYIDQMVEVLRSTDADAVYCDGAVVDQDGVKVSHLLRYRASLPVLLTSNHLVPSRVAWRVATIRELRLFADPALAGCDDWDAALRVLLAGGKMKHLGRSLMAYRDHARGAHRNVDRMQFAEQNVMRGICPVLPRHLRRLMTAAHHVRFAQYWLRAGHIERAGEHFRATSVSGLIHTTVMNPRLTFRLVKQMVKTRRVG